MGDSSTNKKFKIELKDNYIYVTKDELDDFFRSLLLERLDKLISEIFIKERQEIEEKIEAEVLKLKETIDTKTQEFERLIIKYLDKKTHEVNNVLAKNIKKK